ncbi:MAG: hypothetical protein HPY61_13935 [Methanotrichaceae archaeon]|nr:hypothetical protein [Methanotrichaceae archaeon]
MSGDYGRNVLSTLSANQTQAAEDTDGNNTLWNWGSVPKGGIIVDGTLVEDPFSALISGMGDYSSLMKPVGVDVFTGNTIYSYVVPSTGVTRYFYLDHYTEKPVYVEESSLMTEPVAAGTAESASSTGSTGSTSMGSSYSLPPIFR